ncbi:hypothetical protein I0C86_37840 [Plantactinospora sp. S1510]|uniref:Peptidase MA-like domain-containing protein n=1 Tax=Plantactinospora alkalitolerans TaxID=2789879 RepID=A0ABS0H991_9ACTN|nr:hypothetical protein [Plantactinospora alkalitolerans]
MVIGTVLVLLLCGAPVVAGAVVLARNGTPEQGPDTGTAAASPEPGDAPTVTRDWLGDRVMGLLEKQATALLSGDENGYLALAEPGTPLSRQLRREFRTLRAMQVTKWQPELHGKLVRLDEPGTWRADLIVQHCFVTPACELNEITIATRWRDTPGQPQLTAIDPPSGADRPRPWETDELVASIGDRTLVATPRAFRDRLPELLREAEKAAKVADRYAVDDSPPERYLIFYAGPNEWKLWYGGDRPEWTAGYAVPVGAEQYDLVLNSKGLAPGQYGELMRHELTHASSLSGAGRIGGDAWWLVEGMAENAAASGQSVNRYQGLRAVERLVDAGWDGKLEDVAPDDDSADWQVAASYGVGYLAVRHLVDRFGDEDVLKFFELVVHDGSSEEDASQEAFGVAWTTLHDDCVKYVKKTAS